MEIKIGKSARACTACEHSFVHDEELRSLVRVQNQELIREDYCAVCWDPERAFGAFSVWSTRFYDATVAEQEPPEVFSPLRQLFYEAVEADNRNEMAKAYLAAQLLRRQKVFRFIKESDDPETGARVTLFTDRIGNRFIEVRDPDLNLAEMEVGRRALLERLNELENAQTTEENPDNAEEAEQPESPAAV